LVLLLTCDVLSSLPELGSACVLFCKTASHGLYRRTQLLKAETDSLAFIDCARSSGQFGAYQH